MTSVGRKSTNGEAQSARTGERGGPPMGSKGRGSVSSSCARTPSLGPQKKCGFSGMRCFYDAPILCKSVVGSASVGIG